MRKRLFLLVGLVLAWSPKVQARPLFPWLTPSDQRSQRLSQRFAPPRGYKRVPLRRGSFAWWLRRLPLLPKGSPVMLHDGSRKGRQDVHAAVIQIDIGQRDLQQCADAVMRVWGEYLWSRNMARLADFHFASGQRNPWLWWSRGDRIRLRDRGRRVVWKRRVARPDRSYQNYQRYLRFVMAWANTSSLVRQLRRVPISQAQPGDLFLQGWRGGQPGHAVLILDVVRDARGRKRFLLAQSYMPAQSFHVLKAPRQRHSPWYRFPKKGDIETPEWTFTTKDLFRLPHTPATRP
ncbi:MAG: hypothetical protein H6728_08745 [Myxococcales bacterium]|nr:hypothetical protein [Myxococcales bacterium]